MDSRNVLNINLILLVNMRFFCNYSAGVVILSTSSGFFTHTVADVGGIP